MTAEAYLEHLETLCREAREADPERFARLSTHFSGCWTQHPGCAVPVVEELVRELRAAGRQQVTLDRIIVDTLFRAEPKALDSDQDAELDRIRDVWKVDI